MRLDLAPVVLARQAQHPQLVLVEMHMGRLHEQPAVDVARFRVQAAGRAGVIAVEPVKQQPEVVGA